MSREIIIGGYIGGCKKAYVEIYCSAQFSRQFGLIQVIPCLYPGEVNTNLSARGRVDKNQLSRINMEYKRLRANFQPYKFTIIVGPPHPRFSQWWHNTIELYNKSEAVKVFIKGIGIVAEEVAHLDTLSDDGFGRGPKDGVQGGQEGEAPEVQSSTLTPVILDVKPLQSVPYIVTRAQKQKATTSPIGILHVFCKIFQGISFSYLCFHMQKPPPRRE